MKKALLLPIILTICISSCYYTDCISDELRFQLIGFSDQEASRITLRRYTKGNNFNQLIDTALLDIEFSRKNDTLFPVRRLVNMQITSKYDFELSFPLTNKTFRLTQITEPQSQKKKSWFNNTKEACINSITNCTVNGTPIHTLFSLIYLTK